MNADVIPENALLTHLFTCVEFNTDLNIQDNKLLRKTLLWILLRCEENSVHRVGIQTDSIFTLILPRWWERANNLPHFGQKDQRLKWVLERSMLQSLGGDDGVSDEEESRNLDFNRAGGNDCQHPSMWGRCFAAVGVALLRPCVNFLLQCWV